MSSESMWYYTDNTGGQVGPVPIADIQRLIAENRIPTSAIAWTEGMADWQPINQIDALQQTPAPAPASAAVAASASEQTANPYATPTAQPGNPNLNSNQGLEYGGIRRLAYFLRMLLLSIGIIAIVAITAFISADSSEPSPIIIIVGVILFIVFYIRFMIQRIRNIGWSAWWLFLMFIPIISNLLSIALTAIPEGYAHHKKMDTAGIVIAVLLAGLTLLSFALNLLGLFVA